MKKNTENTVAEKTSAEKMMTYLKSINHNEKIIKRLETKIQKLIDANDKLRSEFKKIAAE